MYKATSFISGNSVLTDKEIEIFSPIDGTLVGTVPSLEDYQLIEAFDSAYEAFLKWSQVNYQTRSKYIMAFAAKLKENIGILSQIVHLEVGKSIEEAKDEIIRSAEYIVETVHAYSDLMERPEEYSYENNILIPKGINATFLRVPHGVALTISPFNYPVNLMITKIVPAIITGNSVVHKSATPGSITGWFISKIFNELTVDEFLITPGVLNYVTGRGSIIGKCLIKSKHINSISFTGSTEVGKNIISTLPTIPIQLELGGHNPAVILEDADLDLAISEIIKGAFKFSGQRCTSIKKVFINKKIYSKFIKLFKEKLKKIKLTEPLINAKAVQRMKDMYEESLSSGAELISDPLEISGNYVTPMVFLSSDRHLTIFKEEIFAPVLAILLFEKDEEVIDFCNDSRYGLQASIFSANIDRAAQIALKLEFGRVNINSSPARSPDILPFSGIKDSGFEVQGIKNSLFFFTRFKGIVLKSKVS